jgi:TRAP-type mannitol/chloroaromatic compound transport system substrate-binding protein
MHSVYQLGHGQADHIVLTVNLYLLPLSPAAYCRYQTMFWHGCRTTAAAVGQQQAQQLLKGIKQVLTAATAAAAAAAAAVRLQTNGGNCTRQYLSVQML